MIRKNIFACLFSAHNTRSLSHQELKCLIRLHFERCLSHRARWWEKSFRNVASLNILVHDVKTYCIIKMVQSAMTSLEFPLQLFSSFQKRTLVLFQLLTCKFNLFQKLVFAYLLLFNIWSLHSYSFIHFLYAQVFFWCFWLCFRIVVSIYKCLLLYPVRQVFFQTLTEPLVPEVKTQS